MGMVAPLRYTSKGFNANISPSVSFSMVEYLLWASINFFEKYATGCFMPSPSICVNIAPTPTSLAPIHNSNGFWKSGDLSAGKLV